MPDTTGVHSLDVIYHDLEGTEKAAARVADFFARGAEALRGRRPVRTRGGPPPGVGRRLLTGCRDTTRQRYETLLFFEGQFPPGGDFGYLIGPACTILEAELNRLLTEPGRAIAADLVAALRADASDDAPAAVLEKWAGG